jgi:hypothetical protein
MKPKWTHILFAILISSCAANRIENDRTPDQLSHIKSGHFKGSKLACPSTKLQHTLTSNKATLPGQSVSHRSAVITNHRYLKWKSNVAFTKKSKRHDENKLAYLERADKDFVTDFSKTNLPIKQIITAPLRLPVSQQQKYKEIIFGENHPASYRMPILTHINPNQSKLQPPHNTENLIYLTVLLAGLLSLAALKITPDLAGKISYWAALNPGKSIFIISVLQIMTGMAGLFLGTKLANMGTQFSGLSKGIVAATFFASLIFYPVRKSRLRLFKRTYFRQKIHDVVLFLSGFLFMVYAGFHYSGQINSLTHTAGKQNCLQEHENVFLEEYPPQNPPAFLQQANQEPDKSSAPPKDGWSTGQKVFLTILTFMASIGLGYGVAVLSCELSCSGLNGLAVIVAILGVALIAALIYFSMKAIFNPKHKQTKSPAPA